MNREELSEDRLRQIEISGRAFVSFIVGVIFSIFLPITACFIQEKLDTRERAGDIIPYLATPCFIYGLVNLGKYLLAKHRIKKIREKEMIFEVMED